MDKKKGTHEEAPSGLTEAIACGFRILERSSSIKSVFQVAPAQRQPNGFEVSYVPSKQRDYLFIKGVAAFMGLPLLQKLPGRVLSILAARIG
jgi:hypothetical protein